MASDLACYVRTRLASRSAFMLYGVVLVAFVAAGAAPTLAPLALLAVATLRLWDDLADLDHDRARDPQRVLSRTPHIATFRTVLYGCLAMTSAWIACARGLMQAFAFSLLIVALATIYRGIPSILRTTRITLVLLKYPALVLLFAGTGWSAVAAAAALYLLLVLNDLRDEVRT